MSIAELGRTTSEPTNPEVFRSRFGEFSIVGYTADMHPLLRDEPRIKRKLFSAERVVNEAEIIRDDTEPIPLEKKLPIGRSESLRNSHVAYALLMAVEGLKRLKRLGKLPK